MPPPETNPSLLVRVRNPQDASSWREFEDRYGLLIVSYARACGLQTADAEDVRQIVLVKLARALPGFEYQPERGRFRSYLRRVVRNEMNRHLGRSRRRAGEVSLDARTEPVLAIADTSDDTDPIWEQEWVRHHYRRAWRAVRHTCDGRSLEVFDHLLAGVSVNGVAASLAMAPATVRKIKQRMRDRLRRQIALQLAEEEEERGCPSHAETPRAE